MFCSLDPRPLFLGLVKEAINCACCCNMEQISDFSASCKEAALPPLTHSAVIVITFNVPAHTEQWQY